ncbi:hypothetical protein CR513_25041, partial [Mucuna pruriens]
MGNFINGFRRSQNNLYSSHYNPAWRKHPNFSWGGQLKGQTHNGQRREERRPSLQDTMTQYMTKNNKKLKAMETQISNVPAMSNKKKLKGFEVVNLTEKYYMLIQGVFTIPCTMSKSDFEKALCDLSASINMMFYSILRNLASDKIITHPLGIIEDVLVKLGEFIFLVDFVILDMEEEDEAIGRAVINVEQGKLTLKLGNKEDLDVSDVENLSNHHNTMKPSLETLGNPKPCKDSIKNWSEKHKQRHEFKV